MLVFLLPFVAVIGALVFSGRDRGVAPAAAPAYAVGAAAPPPRALPAPPTPLAVLHDYVRANVIPPPFVVQCAIAEAELLGRFDVAHQITKTYLIPSLMSHGQGGNAPAPVIDAKAEEATAAPQNPAEAAASSRPAPERMQLPAVSTRSPIAGVPDPAWQAFAGVLVREAPDFDGPRHVGRYHHRKDRLAQIGFDVSIVAGNTDVQDDAFAADIADAFRHLAKSGTLDAVIGKGVAVPEVAGPVPITLSGVLGLAAVGGLEGAIGWLERTEDRTRYPNTTQAFLRSNGVF